MHRKLVVAFLMGWTQSERARASLDEASSYKGMGPAGDRTYVKLFQALWATLQELGFGIEMALGSSRPIRYFSFFDHGFVSERAKEILQLAAITQDVFETKQKSQCMWVNTTPTSRSRSNSPRVAIATPLQSVSSPAPSPKSTAMGPTLLLFSLSFRTAPLFFTPPCSFIQSLQFWFVSSSTPLVVLFIHPRCLVIRSGQPTFAPVSPREPTDEEMIKEAEQHVSDNLDSTGAFDLFVECICEYVYLKVYFHCVGGLHVRISCRWLQLTP